MINARISLAALAAAGLVFVSGGGARADLITNGGFETGDFTGWTTVGPGIIIDSTPGFAHTGTFDAQFIFPTTGLLSQDVTTTPGASYNLSFWVLDEGGPLFGDSFTVTFGTFSAIVTGDQAFPYTMQSFLIPGADVPGATTTLSFQLTGSSSNWNLDDVSMTAAAVPGPVVGAGLPGLIFITSGLLFWSQRRRRPA